MENQLDNKTSAFTYTDQEKLIANIHRLIQNQTKDWLRTQDAANYLGISVTQIHNLKREGILPYSKVGGTIYFKKSDIDTVLEANKTEV